MNKLICLLRINSTKFFTFFTFLMLLFISCNDLVDELWDEKNPRDDFSPLIGDWYADSIKSFYSCTKTDDSTAYVMSDSYIEEYNLWLLSDGSLQLYFTQDVNLKYECEDFYGTWDNEDGCSDSYYEYYDYSPIEFCNTYFEHSQYNIETTSCSQSAFINGTWTANEAASTVTVIMDSVCVNSFGNQSYISSPDSCNMLEYSEYFEMMEKVFTYTVDSDSGKINLEGSWFDDDSSCVIFHMSLQ